MRHSIQKIKNRMSPVTYVSSPLIFGVNIIPLLTVCHFLYSVQPLSSTSLAQILQLSLRSHPAFAI